MSARPAAAPTPSAALRGLRLLRERGGWAFSLGAYAVFAATVYVALGPEPMLGPDHVSYLQLADTILAKCPGGDYWRETAPVRNFAVALAYLHAITGSHIVSMKLLLAAETVVFLLAAELFFALFHRDRLRAMLFALVSAFAVSFGVTSWGLTDSTALLPRSLTAPVVMLAAWLWFRFDSHPARYLAFPLLVLGSLLHLSAFYFIGVLVLVELLDVVLLRRLVRNRLVPAFVAGLAAAVGLQFALESAGLSSKAIGVQVPVMLRSAGFDVPNFDTPAFSSCRPAAEAASPPSRAPARLRAVGIGSGSLHVAAAAPDAVTRGVEGVKGDVGADSVAATAQEAWAIELKLRPWRNMPMPLVNVANMLASSALVLALAFAGLVVARRAGFTRADRLMLLLFVAVPVFAILPQTLLWVLRSHTNVYPINIEEVRALAFVMIPALYFVSRLYAGVADGTGPWRRSRAAAIVAGALVLPLFMKNLPPFAREGILSVMTTTGVVDPGSPAAIANARAALGLTATLPLYYATRGARDWLTRNARRGARVLTDRDDMVLLRDLVVLGPRQVGATSFFVTPEQAQLFGQVVEVFGSRDTTRVLALAISLGADFAVVTWPVPGAAYADANVSIVAVPSAGKERP